MRRRQVSRTQTTSLARRFATPSVTKRYFLPTSIAGCQLWLDAADATTTKSVASSGIWVDKSGSSANTSYVAGGSGFSLGTINSLPAVTFPGGTNNLLTANVSMSSTSGFSIFFLASRSSSFPSGARYMANESSSLQVYGISTTTIGTYAGAPFSSTSLTNSTDVPFVFSLVVSSSSFNQWGNGVVNSSTGTTGSVSGTKLIIGASGTGYESIFVFAGQMGEIIVYNSALPTPQRQVVEGYLAHKWGITKYYSPSFPLSISGCQLWLDAADSSSLTLSGNTVTSWRDKSGNGLNVSAASSQPTYLTNAANGLGTLAFNGSQGLNAGIVRGDKLIGNTGSCAIFVVVRFANTSGRSMPFSWDDETYTSRLLFQNSQTSEIALDQGPFPNNRTNATVSLSNNLYYIFSYSQNGSNTKLNRNGITIASLTNFSTTTIASSSRLFNVGPYINGSEWNMNGNIAEILFFNTNIPNKFQEVEIYLARKWGITIAEPLPSSHPYLNFIPGSLKEFVPTSLSGCQLWLDGADSSTVAVTTTVTQWRDKSGNTRHLGVGSGTTSYSSKAIQLANSYMFVTSPIDLTKVSVFIVAKTTGGNNQTVFSARPDAGFSWSSLDGFGFYMDSQSSIRFYGELSNNSSFNVNTSTPQLFSFQSSGTSISGRYNGTSQSGGTLTSSRTSTAKGFAIGGEWHRDQNEYINFVANASIYEIITYNTDLTTNQLQQVEGYLALKWGLTGSLPSGHPYKAFSPYLSLTPTFLPTLIPGCMLWLDGNDTSSQSMILTGNTVNTWKDKSGNGYNYTQTSYSTTLPPLSNIKTGTGVYFGSQQGLYNTSFPFPTSYTIFSVANQTTNLGGYQYILHSPYNADYIIFFGSLNGNFATFTGSGGWNDTNANSPSSSIATTSNTASILCCTNNGTTLTPYFNSVAMSTKTGTNSAATGMTLGDTATGYPRQPWLGTIGEIIIYNSVLTTTQRQQVESYLAWKWGLQTSLPSDHTYKFAPPSV